MTAQSDNKHVLRYALRGEPIFDTSQERAATLVTLVGLNNATSSAPGDSFADIFKRLHESGIEQLFGNEPLLLEIPIQEARGILDIPWARDRVIVYLESSQETDAHDIEALHNKIWDKEYSFVTNDALRASLPTDKPQPLMLIAATDAADSFEAPKNLPPLPIWMRHVPNRSLLESVTTSHAAEWVSGRFWKTPNIQPGRAIPASRLGSLKLLAELQNPNITIEQVERIINCDATLSYKLLKLLNSAFFSSPGRVDSIRNGVNFFGLQRIKNWATVIVMNSVDFKPRDILPLGAYRARLAELVANALRHEHPQDYYLVGLFSVLDAMFDSTIEELVAPLHLQGEVLNALASGTGPMGEVVSWIRAIEEGQTFAAPSLAKIAEIDVLQLQLDALSWTNEFCRSISS